MVAVAASPHCGVNAKVFLSDDAPNDRRAPGDRREISRDVRRLTTQKAALEAENLAERNELAAKVEQMHEARYGGREKVKASLLQDLGSAEDWAGRLQDDPA
jgi:hypothetical protein